MISGAPDQHSRSVPKGGVMVIRVAAQDVESAKRPVVGMVSASSAVSASRSGRTAKYSFSPTRNRTEPSLKLWTRSDWLEETRFGSAELWVDERLYRVDRPRSLHQVASV